MRVHLTGPELHRISRSWPALCCGCGVAPTGSYPAFVRKNAMSTLGTLAGVAGHGARWTTFTLDLPACSACRRRARLVPLVWAALCVALFFAGLMAMKAGLHFEPDGTPVVGAVRALRLASLGGFAVSVFLGAPLFLVLQRRAAPATIAELRGRSWDELDSIDLACGSAEFVAAVERARA